MLHVIGNSHARFFCGEELTGGKSWRVFEPYQAIPDFKVWTINGGPTAWNFTNKYLTQVYDMGIPVESKLLLCFGEIDVRHTIPKRFDKLTDAMVNLMVCVNRYFFGIDELSKLYKVAFMLVFRSALVMHHCQLDKQLKRCAVLPVVRVL